MGTPSKESVILSVNQTLESLIHRIEPLTHKKGKDIDISDLLEEFYTTVIQSEMYLQNGVLAINFGKAAVFLDYAFSIYSKQVDLLWDMAIDSERRFLSYEEDSVEKVEAQKKLEEKATKGKRRRKKKLPEEKPIEVDYKQMAAELKQHFERIRARLDEEYQFDLEGLWTPEFDKSVQRTIERVRNITSWKKYPDKYLIKPYIETSCIIELDDDCIFNNENVYANKIEFLWPETERKMQYNYGGKTNIDTIGCDVGDTALAHYVAHKGIAPADFTKESYAEFDKYLHDYKTHGPQHALLFEQQKKLCPRRTSIMLTRLPDEVLQKYLKPETSTTEAGNTLFGGETSKFTVGKEDNNDSGLIDGSPDLDDGPDDAPMAESTPITEKNAAKRKEKRLAKRKSDAENEGETPRKRIRKKSEIFKWLKTTTASLKKFEKFFNSTYLTEEGEGEVPYQEFSSDDEDNGSQDFIPETTQHLNTSVDSGLGDSLNSSQATNAETTTSSLENQTPENQENPLPKEKSLWELEQEELNEIQLRYFEWSDYIREELKKYTNQDFDIHEYGTRILDKFSEEKQTVCFNEICQVEESESSSNIARFFAAALQLTNTGNVELTNWTEGELATDLQLTFVSKERHHEHLGEYKAPSQKEMPKNVDKIKNLRVDKDDFLRKIEDERNRFPDSIPGHSGVKKVRSYKRAKIL